MKIESKIIIIIGLLVLASQVYKLKFSNSVTLNQDAFMTVYKNGYLNGQLNGLRSLSNTEANQRWLSDSTEISDMFFNK